MNSIEPVEPYAKALSGILIERMNEKTKITMNNQRIFTNRCEIHECHALAHTSPTKRWSYFMWSQSRTQYPFMYKLSQPHYACNLRCDAFFLIQFGLTCLCTQRLIYILYAMWWWINSPNWTTQLYTEVFVLCVWEEQKYSLFLCSFQFQFDLKWMKSKRSYTQTHTHIK